MTPPHSLSQLLSVVNEANDEGLAKHFAEQHALSYSPEKLSTPYVLEFNEGATRLLQRGKGAPGPISASFLNGKVAHRRQFGGGKGQLIAKAVGVQSGIMPRVLDATAGLGRDAFVLATLGCEVTMLERSPVVAELLRSALQEAQQSEVAEIIARMHLIDSSALTWMSEQAEVVADVVYLDPMYPTREKSALVKKEMRAFHDLVGADPDADALLPLAMSCARCRVVVKRPRLGEQLGERPPTLTLSGKSCRYDIYVKQSLNVLRTV